MHVVSIRCACAGQQAARVVKYNSRIKMRMLEVYVGAPDGIDAAVASSCSTQNARAAASRTRGQLASECAGCIIER